MILSDGLSIRSPRRVLSTDISIEDNTLDILKREHLRDKKIFTKIKKFLLSICIIQSILLIGICIYHIYISDNNVIIETNKYFHKDMIEVNQEQFIDIFDGSIDKNKTSYSLQYIINDKKYLLADFKLVNYFIKKDKTNDNKYIMERNDCDNYAFILFGNFLKFQISNNFNYSLVFGVAYLKDYKDYYSHTVNFFVDYLYNVYCIEPQNDIITRCDSNIIYRLIL